MMDNINELLERLTERGAGQYRHEEDTGSIQWMVKPDRDCKQAATALRAQQAEIERLNKLLYPIITVKNVIKDELK